MARSVVSNAISAASEYHSLQILHQRLLEDDAFLPLSQEKAEIPDHARSLEE